MVITYKTTTLKKIIVVTQALLLVERDLLYGPFLRTPPTTPFSVIEVIALQGPLDVVILLLVVKGHQYVFMVQSPKNVGTPLNLHMHANILISHIYTYTLI